jgi:hypothetical protein
MEVKGMDLQIDLPRNIKEVERGGSGGVFSVSSSVSFVLGSSAVGSTVVVAVLAVLAVLAVQVALAELAVVVSN